MSAIKITITSCENPEHCYTFQEPTVAATVAALVLGMAERCDFDHGAIGLLVETVGKAIQDPKGFAKEWDFSAPDDAFTVQFEEIDTNSPPSSVEYLASTILSLHAEAMPLPDDELVKIVADVSLGLALGTYGPESNQQFANCTGDWDTDRVIAAIRGR